MAGDNAETILITCTLRLRMRRFYNVGLSQVDVSTTDSNSFYYAEHWNFGRDLLTFQQKH